MEDFKDKPLSIESEGKTIEEAVQKALGILKVQRSQIAVRVLSEEQKGLFGMHGAKSAKIRVTVVNQPDTNKKA